MGKTVFFVESEEEFALCPCCNEALDFFCWVDRKLTNTTGNKEIYKIRVLKCANQACPTKYHRELPDIITPYKRYGTNSIEEALTQDGAEVTVAADESTIRCWRKWFAKCATYMAMALLSVPAMVGNNAETSSHAT